MREQDFEKRPTEGTEPPGVYKNEEAIADFENEGGFMPPYGQEELEGEKESFVERAVKYCRVVHGKLLCRIGEHNYIEVGREKFHGGKDEFVHLRCTRKDCPRPKAWTEWHGGKQVI